MRSAAVSQPPPASLRESPASTTLRARQRGWEICGEARTGREAVAKASELRSDIVVMDFAMPELNGMEATRQIPAAVPQTEVLILNMHESDKLMGELLAAGARG